MPKRRATVLRPGFHVPRKLRFRITCFLLFVVLLLLELQVHNNLVPQQHDIPSGSRYHGRGTCHRSRVVAIAHGYHLAICGLIPSLSLREKWKATSALESFQSPGQSFQSIGSFGNGFFNLIFASSIHKVGGPLYAVELEYEIASKTCECPYIYAFMTK